MQKALGVSRCDIGLLGPEDVGEEADELLSEDFVSSTSYVYKGQINAKGLASAIAGVDDARLEVPDTQGKLTHYTTLLDAVGVSGCSPLRRLIYLLTKCRLPRNNPPNRM